VQEKLPHEHGASHCPHTTSRRGVLRDCCSEHCLEVVTCSASDLPPQPLISAFSFLIRGRGLRAGPTNCVKGRSCFNILVIKVNDMHYFSALFGKELYMFRTGLRPIIRSLNTVFTAIGICHTSRLSAALSSECQITATG